MTANSIWRHVDLTFYFSSSDFLRVVFVNQFIPINVRLVRVSLSLDWFIRCLSGRKDRMKTPRVQRLINQQNASTISKLMLTKSDIANNREKKNPMIILVGGGCDEKQCGESLGTRCQFEPVAESSRFDWTEESKQIVYLGWVCLDAMQMGAQQFTTNARDLKRKYWWKNLKVSHRISKQGEFIVLIRCGRF